jgi:hypothetical protein
MRNRDVYDGMQLMPSSAESANNEPGASTLSDDVEPMGELESVSTTASDRQKPTNRVESSSTIGSEGDNAPATQHLRATPRIPDEPELPVEAAKGLQTRTPVWLSTPVLVLFALSFTLMTLVTISLYRLSQKNNGTGTPRPESFNTWKYGPTAGESDNITVNHSID